MTEAKTGSTFRICYTSHGIESQHKRQTRKNNNIKFKDLKRKK